MENRFHLAIPAGDLDKAIKFYCDVLGCQRGNSEFKYLHTHDIMLRAKRLIENFL